MPSNGSSFPASGLVKPRVMKEETVKTDRLTLHFSDVELEGAFRVQYALSHQNRLKFLCVAVVVATVVQLVLDVVREFDLLSLLLRLIPVLLLVVVLAVTFTKSYVGVMKNDYSQHIVATAVAVFLVTARILAVTPGEKREVNEGTTGFLFLTLGGLCVLSAVRYTAAVVAGIFTVGWYIVAAFIWRQDSMLNVASTVVTAFLALVVFVYVTRDFELSERRDFVLTSRLREEKVDLNFKLEGFSLFQRATEKSTAKADFSKVVIDPDTIQMGPMLGRGGFGAVHRGEWLQTEVAIKVLNSEALKEAVMTEFHDEALMMSNMRHPNVVLFMGISIAPPMLVMEMMHRGSLYKIIHQDKIQMHWTLIVKMAMDSARGMNFLHTHSPPLVHRDLKSLNLLVARDWRVKVSDFGLTKLQKQHDVALKTDQVVAGGPGTLAWAAPEVLKERPSVTAKSDVYSFGIVLYELVFRREPFKKAHTNAIPFLVTEGKRPWTDESLDVNDPCLQGLVTLMQKCCHQKASKRPTFADILRELDDVARKHIKIESGTFDDHVQLPVKTNRRGSTIDSPAMSPATSGQFTIQMKNIELGPKIGRGGNAVVYEALYNGTHVAVKELFVKASQDELVREFQKECQLMLNLRHPNIVLFMGSAASDGQLYMVTELMVNGSLFQIYHNQSRSKVSSKRRLRLSADTARGMQYLHSLNPPIIHRDLKSPNVLVSSNWEAKVADFGLSRYKDESKTMTTCGSPLWAAPEVLRGERFGEPCDVFSFAIIVWELMAWEEPYAGMDSMQVMTSVARSKLRPPMPDHISPGLKTLLEQMWDDDQFKRPTFAKILDALEDMIG